MPFCSAKDTSMSDTYVNIGRANTPQALSNMLERNWWVIGLRGLLAVLFGLCAFLFTGGVILSLVLLFVIFALVDGVFALTGAIRAMRHHHHWAFLALQGAASIIAAVLAFFWPGLTVLAFVLLLAAWSLVSGATMVAMAFSAQGNQRWWMLLSGVISVIFGLALVIAPIIGAVVLTWWLGSFALVFGVSLIVLAFTLRSHLHGTHTGTPAHA
jgi:uncharacterized membrane protein HdeD (DUF308 family)